MTRFETELLATGSFAFIALLITTTTTARRRVIASSGADPTAIFRLHADRLGFPMLQRMIDSFAPLHLKDGFSKPLYAERLNPMTATPNHAMQLTGSARHGLCYRPADLPAQAAPRSACS